jgi:cbb3-type cytochrome oxidase cytochrome c subunit
VEPQERHYNINTLNVIFAVSSIILLAALLWLFADDYSRTWKDYQRKFRSMEIGKTRGQYQGAVQKLQAEGEYQAILKNLETAREDFEANCNSEESRRERIRRGAENDLRNQDYKFAKAEYDAARYRYESAMAHHPQSAGGAKKDLDRSGKKIQNLKIAVDMSNHALKEQEEKDKSCGAKMKDLQRQERLSAREARILETRLARIDPARMSFANRMADLARDFPLIDFANPNYKIEQIVLADMTEDINFTHVPTVDRCLTCHLGVANPDYQEAPQPFTTHPDLGLFLRSESPHPLEEFGCMVCHGGRGRGTDFTSAAHTPSSEKQSGEWKGKYGWHELTHWDRPMLPLPYVQSSCFKCHSAQTVIPGAEKLNLGINLIEKAGCYNCHFIAHYKDWPKPGPDLTKVASKISREWAYRWVQDPHAFRPDTWMPAFFHQSNTSDPQSVKRNQQEMHALVHYLFNQSGAFAMEKMLLTGDPRRGEEIAASVGCLGCHQVTPPQDVQPTTRASLRRLHGPNLSGMGSKTSPEWIYNWLRDPHRYNPQTRMPDMRLSDGEAADVAAYLSGLKNSVYENVSVPAVDEKTVDEIVLAFLSKSETLQQAQARLLAMSLDEKLEFSGLRLIRHYGCFSCHNIKGFEKDKPIGTELTSEGSKTAHQLDFGFVPIDHSAPAWFAQKLRDPRIFDEGRIKPHDEKLRMPNFEFTDEEVGAIVTVILGLGKDKPSAKIVPRTTSNLFREEGQKMVRLYNCQGCHVIESGGGAVQPSVREWLTRYENRSANEAGAIVSIFSPPNLDGEGKKVQPKWLFDFMHEPSRIRPWLKVRMPTYRFSTAQLNTLVKYLSALDNQEFPFGEKAETALSSEERQAAEKLFSQEYFDCAKCHIVGDKFPEGSPENWAPDFALARERLKPQWIIDWLKDPQGLSPGTKMPTYFDPAYFDASGPDDILGGSEHEQIRVLRNYLMTLTASEGAPAADAPAAASF